MSSTPRRRPTSPLASGARLLVVVGLVPALLAGCGSGIEPETYKARQLADAVNASVGQIALGNVYLNPTQDGSPHPPGSDVDGVIALINNGQEEDRLVSVRSDAASSVVMLEGTQEVSSPVIPPGKASAVTGFALKGTTRPLAPASYVTLTLQFEKAGTQDVRVPVSTGFESKRTEKSRVHEEEEAEAGSSSESGTVPADEGEEAAH